MARRDLLIAKLSDQMDRDQAIALVDEAIAEAVDAIAEALREKFTEANPPPPSEDVGGIYRG